MKKIGYHIIWVLLLQVLILGCAEEDPKLGTPPSEADAEFTIVKSDESDNILILSNSSASGFLKKWSFGNGKIAEGSEVEAVYPFKGTYEVTLTIYTSGGSISSKKTVEIAQTDLTLLSPLEKVLASDVGKTWKIDAETQGHMAVGPIASYIGSWWSAPPNVKDGAGLYDDRFTFSFEGLAFTQETNGNVYVHTDHESAFSVIAPSSAGDFTANYNSPSGLTWFYSEESGKKFINITNGGWIGFYTGVSKYEVLSFSETLIVLRFTDTKNSERVWYHRLIPADYTPPPPPSFTLPIDFEGDAPAFFGFGDGGDTQFSVVANPASGGINTTAKVGKMVKGVPEWSGMVATLDNTFDFSTNGKIKMKVYSTYTCTFRIKIEHATDGGQNREVDASVTQANQWQELTFDFSTAPSGTFKKLVIFPDFGNNAGGTFYIDDIVQTN